MAAEIRTVGVLGCGLMGSGIVEVCAKAGFSTLVLEQGEEALMAGMRKIQGSLGRAVERKRLGAEEATQIESRISGTTTVEDLAPADLVIEAVVEDLGLKKELFSALDRLCSEATIFASNTSSLTITELAGATDRADRFAGLHFFNPVPVMKLVEVVRAVRTSAETFERAFAFAKSIGKEPIACKDSSGFVVNRLLVPYILGAVRAVEAGVASVPDIDKGMMLGCGHPMGPLTLLDFVGLDTTHRIAEIMFEEYKDPLFASPPLLRRMVLAGYHGKKSGRGFYDWSGDKPVPSELGL
ncbi:MAG: 3-hydroxybutyryl-CoA dehydrogenase [Gemmatimonadetes bacterium]|nr:3-hydroxybutyryl-CoA dehydrogenase [Gemmatimonadota bacterium]